MKAPPLKAKAPSRPVAIAALAFVMTCTLAVSPQAHADGAIFAPELMSKKLRKRYPAYIPPRIWIYDDSGKPVGDVEGYPIATPIPLKEGWYRVEVGNLRQEKNRARLYVLDGHTTHLPMGLVLLETDPVEEQPTDLCRTWDAAFEVALPIGEGPGLPVGSNFSAKRATNGAVTMLAGYYRIAWNSHWIAAEIKAGEAFQVPTSLAGPMSGPGYRLHVEKKATTNQPGLKMCERRPTRVLSRRYWVSILRRLSQPPFRELAWAPFKVDRPEGKLYSSIRMKKPRGKVNKEPGHAPLLMWEIPDTTPALPTTDAPKTSPSPTAPEGEPK